MSQQAEENLHPLVCRFGALGDMVLITPLLRALHQRGGRACDLVTIGRVNALLFEQMPYVRNVFSIDSRAAPYWLDRSQRRLIETLRGMRHRHVWICETDPRSYRLLARAGIRRDNSASQLDLEPVPGEHYCETWLRLAGLSPGGFAPPMRESLAPYTELFVSEAEREACRQWLHERGVDPTAPIVCVQAGNRRTTRRGRVDRNSNTKYWPPRNWAAVIDEICVRLPRAQVLLCGVAAELGMCHDIMADCRSDSRVIVVADNLPLRRLLALLSLAHSCISVDTGPAHVAAALNCPLVVLFGKADPARFRPVSATSPVRVVVGHADAVQATEPDMAYIEVGQVVDEWLGATPMRIDENA